MCCRDINIGKGRLQDEANPLSLASSAVLVLCLNLDRTTTFVTEPSSDCLSDIFRALAKKLRDTPTFTATLYSQ